MSNPFTPYCNSVLKFKIPNGSPSVNSVGNTTYTKVDVEVKALLQPVTNPTELRQYLGVERSGQLYYGYLIKPLPEGVELPMDCTVEMETTMASIRNGKGKVLLTIMSPYLVKLGIDLINKIYVIINF